MKRISAFLIGLALMLVGPLIVEPLTQEGLRPLRLPQPVPIQLRERLAFAETERAETAGGVFDPDLKQPLGDGGAIGKLVGRFLRE